MQEIEMNRKIADDCYQKARNGENEISNMKEILDSCLYARYAEGNKIDKDFWLERSGFVRDRTWEMLHHFETSTNEVEELYWDIMKFESRYRFESFIHYMEKNRPYDKRFYDPRKKTLSIVVQDLQDLYDRKIKFLGVSLPARSGKELSDDTPVLTIDGWKNHGDLVVGDKVLNSKGKFVDVYHVFPKCESTHIVRFSDGEEIECHENHEWIVYDRSMKKTVVIETKEMIGNEIYLGDGFERYRFQINEKSPIIGENKDFAVEPYGFGSCLGYWSIDTQFTNINEKHIPGAYLTASIEQRLELLAGLLDANGALDKKQRKYYFSTTSEVLKDDFVSLVNTFGWKASVCMDERELLTNTRRVVYTISFNPTSEVPCVLKRMQLKKFSKQQKIGIVEIRESEKKTIGNCISVVGGEYLAGRTLKPTHNSTLCIFFMAFVMGNRPNSHSAMGGHSGILAKGFYTELLNLISTPEYTFAEIFPELCDGKNVIQKQSADTFEINLDKPDRFSTMVCRGIDATWTGAVDISWDGVLYVDDLIRDREHSLNPTRMENTWQTYNNIMVDRKSGFDPKDGTFPGSCELMVGTLWSVSDPLSRMEEMYGDDPLYRFRKIPALDPITDESNFDYEYNGFSTGYYRDMRKRLDEAEWSAKYMQAPFVREGLLYPTDELRFFNGVLPEGDSRVVAVVDVAWGGGDYLSMPIGREYDNGDVYIFDWVYNDGPKERTIPEVVGKIIGNEIRQCRFEGNVGGAMYSSYVDEKLAEAGYKCACTEKKAPNTMAKVEKIIAYAGDVKRKFIFLNTNEEIERASRLDTAGRLRYKRSPEYQKAMHDLGLFVTIGKNTHDDGADSLTQLAMFLEGNGQPRMSRIVRGGRL